VLGGKHVARHDPVNAVTHTGFRQWAVGTVAGTIALVALVVGSEFGSVTHGAALHLRVIAWASAVVLLVSGILATHRLSSVFGRLVERRAAPGAGGAVRVLSTVVGYVFIVLAVLAVLEVQSNTLVGAGVAGVVLGIAAQQSLGNVFAGLVLLVARPFVIGDHIRIRSGALGGIFEASVSEMSLTYVTLRTDDGVLKIPNSAMLAAGVGHPSPTAATLPGPATPGEPGAVTPGGQDTAAPGAVPSSVAQGGAPSGEQPGP
jgi:small-conductance mechanosensitive channel